MTLHLLTILGLAVSSNLDTLGVGLAYGARRFRLPVLSNLICALIPCIGTFLTMALGATVRRVVLEQLGNRLGAAIIIAAGAVLVVRRLRQSRRPGRHEISPERKRPESPARVLTFLRELGRILEDPFLVDRDYSGSIEAKEALVLAVALTLNNLSCGFAAGLLGLNVPLMIGSSFVISLVFFSASVRIGFLVIARWFGEEGDLIAGIMLILLGVYELLM